MAQIILQNIGCSFTKDLFQGVNIAIDDGDRLGIVGNNGSGKTTLLRAVAGVVEPTTGTITRPKKARIGFAEQEVPPVLETLTLHEAIARAITDDRETMEWRVDVVLDSFETPEPLRQRRISDLSGGWRRLMLVARAWVSDPDILLLDEPTNDLDLQKILKLEEWLMAEAKRLPSLIVSHDRRFLDTCTNRTLFLRPRESVSFAYEFSTARDLLAESDRSLANRKEQEQKEALRLRKSAHNLRQIGVNNHSAAALRKSIQIARRASVIEREMTEVHVEPRRDIKLATRDTHAKCLLSLENVAIRTPTGEALFRIKRLEIRQGDRIALLGKNGTGKTCFIERLRASFAAPDAARVDGVKISPSVVMGYIDQDMTQLPEDIAMGKYVEGLVGRDRATGALINAGFSLMEIDQRIGSLSLGQKARLALLALQLAIPTFYLMDEPTNHLDIAGQEQLEYEIIEHATTAVIVSHDRAFVADTGTRFVVIDDGELFEVESPTAFYESLSANISIRKMPTMLHPL